MRWKRVHPVFNEHLLTSHRPPSFPSQKAQEPDLPPNIEDPDAEYDVESILEAGIDEPTQRLKYLVKWDGFGPEENSWEYAEDLVRCSDKIHDFYRRNPGAPHPIAALAKKLRLRPLINFTEVPAVCHALDAFSTICRSPRTSRAGLRIRPYSSPTLAAHRTLIRSVIPLFPHDVTPSHTPYSSIDAISTPYGAILSS